MIVKRREQGIRLRGNTFVTVCLEPLALIHGMDRRNRLLIYIHDHAGHVNSRAIWNSLINTQRR